MNLQEKYNEYKQRQEAKKFFNQNNDYHLSISDYIKMFVVGTVIAIFSTIAFDFISLQIGWSFSYFDILTGYFTGFIVLKIARYGSEKSWNHFSDMLSTWNAVYTDIDILCFLGSISYFDDSYSISNRTV
mgnify:CR=1 FL=1